MKGIINCFFVFLILPAACFAADNQTESLTITTYYPAPYGVYRDLEIHRSIKFTPIDIQANITNPEVGAMAFNKTDKNVYIYKGASDGGWQQIGGGGGSGGGGDLLAGSVHTKDQCTSAGGKVTDIGAASPICKIPGPCTGDWRQFQNWSNTTAPVTCAGSRCVGLSGGGYNCYGFCTVCTVTGTGHKWGNVPVEVCGYIDRPDIDCSTNRLCSATILEMGCF